MPRRKAEAGLEPNRRAELLRAAARLFVEKGFDATTTRDIADAVGMRSGSPFYHFRSKQELLKTAMVEGLDAGYTRLLAAIDGVSEPKQRLRILVRTHLGTLLEGECPAPMLLGETRALDAAAHAEIAAAFDRYQRRGKRRSTNWRKPARSRPPRRRYGCCCSACSTGQSTGIVPTASCRSMKSPTARWRCCSAHRLATAASSDTPVKQRPTNPRSHPKNAPPTPVGARFIGR